MGEGGNWGLRLLNMIIHIERSGGFAGIALKKTVDSDSLPKEKAEQVKGIISDSDFFSLSSELSSSRSRDKFQYKITISVEDKSNTVVFGEETMPDTVRRLVDWIMKE